MVEYALPGCIQENKEAEKYSGASAGSAHKDGPQDAEGVDDLAETFFERGIRYSTGKDVIPDLIVAHKWFNLAAQRGHAAARVYRNDLAREMTPKEIAQAQREAREWIKCEQAARRGSGARRQEAQDDVRAPALVG